MDGTLLSRPSVEPVVSNICDVYSIDRSNYSSQDRPTVIKYTKLHEYVDWPTPQQYKGHCLRRVTEVSTDPEVTSRSLKSVVPYSTKRKVVTIEENADKSSHTNSGGNTKKSVVSKLSSKPTSDKRSNKRFIARSHNTIYRDQTSESTSKTMKRTNAGDKNKPKVVNAKDKVTNPNNKKKSNSNFKPGKKKEATLSEEKSLVYEQLMRPVSPKPPQKSSNNKMGYKPSIDGARLLGPCRTIHVPIEESCGNMSQKEKNIEIDMNDYKRNDFNEGRLPKEDKKVNVKPDTAVKVTETIHDSYDSNCGEKDKATARGDQEGVSVYDSLYIPNCTLMKENKVIELSSDKTVTENDAVTNLNNGHLEEIPKVSMVINPTTHKECTGLTLPNFPECDAMPAETSQKSCNKMSSMTEQNFRPFVDNIPNLSVPSVKIAKQNKVDEAEVFENESSFIIGRATVTYTTEQKINFQVVGSKDIVKPTPDSYPMNVMSILKREMGQNKVDSKKRITNMPTQLYCRSQYQNISDVQSSFNYAFNFNGNDIKPFYIINSITRSIGMFNNIIISEQFQKELEFIGSFMESLQYLETCSRYGKPTLRDLEKSYEALIQGKKKEMEYRAMIAKPHTHTTSERQVYVSKSVCLLNMLIHDEQRRAKNLLFVLKMREDALKDFTKSQIMWLENKKKYDSTEASTLKKKQRGALLKLQHECGEMERMRKALLSLSERRKTALLNTKRTIELKLSGNETIENPENSLGNDEQEEASTDGPTSTVKGEEVKSTGSNNELKVVDISQNEKNEQTEVDQAEKSVQTGDSILGSLLIDESSSSEGYVAVEGGYLNILFDNFALPKIFCEGKEYEMNEEGLKNILRLSEEMRNNASENKFIEKLVDEVRNGDGESTPSTARSLVEELDQFYKEKSTEIIDTESDSAIRAADNEEMVIYGNGDFQDKETNHQITYSTYVQTLDNVDVGNTNTEACSCTSRGQMPSESSVVSGLQLSAIDSPMLYELSSMTAMGAWQPITPADISEGSTEEVISAVSTDKVSEASPTLSAQSTQAVSEAEEIRRQQLAIEQEIKALEQQQCLLVVREIPDKPPPPYMPPVAPRAIRRFLPDDGLEVKVQKHLQEDKIDLHVDSDDSFEMYVKDFCMETVERQREALSDKPWDAINLITKNADISTESIQKRVTSDLRDVLTGSVTGSVATLGNRRSDHIDDILFSEWRRCEPEWTSLHVDEVAVKNQLFDSIFQKILADTIDAYKDIVVKPPEKKD